jgi:hypothetical protein
MKKLIFLLALLVPVSIFAQKEVIDTLFESGGAIDTTVYRIWKGADKAFIMDVSTLADNDTIDIGQTTSKEGCVSFSTDFPLKLTKDTYKRTNNAITTYWFAVDTEAWKMKYLAIRVKCAGACSPAIRFNP